MYLSVTNFIENGIGKIEKYVSLCLQGQAEFGELSNKIHEEVNTMERQLISDLYEAIDAEIYQSIARKKNWTVERKAESKELLDISGTIRYNRTGYRDKRTGKYIYLLDEILGIESHQRISIAAEAQMLEEATMSSYRRGGMRASEYESASKQTVKRLVHETILEMPQETPKEKRKVRYLHIIADEDHVAAQFQQIKGDLPRDSHGNKINTLMPKLICLYEDIVDEASERSKKHRYRLVGKHYFSGTGGGSEGNEALWREVDGYIKAVYDEEALEKIYIAGDGAGWIKKGCEILGSHSRFYLDKFHMMKYVNTSVTHLGEEAEEKKAEIWRCLNGGHKRELNAIYKEIMRRTESESKQGEIINAQKYFMNQWDGIMCRIEEQGSCWRCSAEGQISHVYSDRMSSRPMGWSELGCSQMAKLRAYKWNDGKIIDILKYQKKAERKIKQEEREALMHELDGRHAERRSEEVLYARIPGLENHSMKWLKSIINQAFSA